jgi:hypothetical protein
LLDDRDGLIHPAFLARISRISAARRMQISRDAATALSTLADAAALFRAFPELAHITSAAEPGITLVSASLRRWNSGEVPTSAEIEAVAKFLRVIHAALSKVALR